MTIISPIDVQQQAQVVELTRHYIQQARDALQRPISDIPVLFDLKGRSAGMYRVRGRQREIRFNPYLFAKYFDDNLAQTVPHEVAHYITDVLHGLRHIRPHGNEWREVMQLFGVPPLVTGRYDLQGIPVRRQRQYDYTCGCAIHQLGARRHNMVLRKQRRYFCRQCQGELIAVSSS